MLFSALAPLHAGLTGVDIYKNVFYQQASGASPTTPSNYFANLEAFMANPGDFTSVTVTYPGPDSPASLPLENPTEFGEGPAFATQAAMDAAFPVGTYSFEADPGTVTASLNYTTDAYTADIPALDAATFAALPGMNASQPFTFNFNSFTPNPNATNAETFLTVFGTSFNTGLSLSATSAVMPANTLAPGTSYTYELDFTDRIVGNSNGVPTLIGFDVRTDGTFTTASTPEPSFVFPVGILLLAAALWRVRRTLPV